MISLHYLSALLILSVAFLASDSSAFAPVNLVSTSSFVGSWKTNESMSSLKMGFFDEKERNALTRDSEPQDYFQT
jgi:hypothetical protein